MRNMEGQTHHNGTERGWDLSEAILVTNISVEDTVQRCQCGFGQHCSGELSIRGYYGWGGAE